MTRSNETQKYLGRPCTSGHDGWRYRSTGDCIECMKHYSRTYSKTLPLKYKREKMRIYRENNPANNLIINARSSAIKRGITFTITQDDITLPKTCPCCGVVLAYSNGKGIRSRPLENSPSIDKLYPDLGYVPGNVNIICRRCNSIKNDIV